MANRYEPLESRFLRKVLPPNERGCTLWNGSKLPAGYGLVSRNGKLTGAHRYAYERKHGPIPAGKFVCHRCDVPACVNVDHLFLGTNSENQRDSAAKGRKPRKLTDEQVFAIRKLREEGRPFRAIAAMFGIGESNVRKIVTRSYWPHLIERGLT